MRSARRSIATTEQPATGQSRIGGGHWRLLSGVLAACLLSLPVHASVLDAVRSGNAQTVQAQITAKADIEQRDAEQRTPLLLAVRANNVDIARMLIAAGADVNAKDAIQDTPWLYAAAEGRTDILKLILDTGKANLKDTNRYGGTGLIPAAHHGYPEVVRMLLATDIDKDHVNNLGWTALLEAVILGDGGPTYQQIVKLLVDAGARRDIADRNGVTPLQHARDRGFAEIARLLEG